MTKCLCFCIAALAIAAAGCSPSAPTQQDGEPPLEALVETGNADGAATPQTDTQSASIPAAFQGVWDIVDGSCAQESDLRLEIKPRMVIFYESVGTVKSATIASSDQISVEMAMEGEGDVWDATRAFSLINDGAGMIHFDVSAETESDPIELKRCK